MTRHWSLTKEVSFELPEAWQVEVDQGEIYFYLDSEPDGYLTVKVSTRPFAGSTPASLPVPPASPVETLGEMHFFVKVPGSDVADSGERFTFVTYNHFLIRDGMLTYALFASYDQLPATEAMLETQIRGARFE